MVTRLLWGIVVDHEKNTAEDHAPQKGGGIGGMFMADLRAEEACGLSSLDIVTSYRGPRQQEKVFVHLCSEHAPREKSGRV